MKNSRTRASSANGKGKSKRKKQGTSWPVHYSKQDIAHIKHLQELKGDVLSVSEINARAVRFAVPKFITGEIDILAVRPLPDLPASTPLAPTPPGP